VARPCNKKGEGTEKIELVYCVKDENMVKPDELRLGNWILEAGEPSIVYSLGSGGTSFWELNDIHVHKETGRVLETHEDRFSSIPLTHEMLEACGFKADPEFDTWRKGQFDVDKVHGGWWWTLDDRGDNEGTKQRELKSLHHLQNIYFQIEGKELTLSLSPSERG
jgi:hypothetical protein